MQLNAYGPPARPLFYVRSQAVQYAVELSSAYTKLTDSQASSRPRYWQQRLSQHDICAERARAATLLQTKMKRT